MKLLVTALLALLILMPEAYAQREASFVQPGTGPGGKRDNDDAIAASPREMDVGDTIVGITKRVRLYFTNYSGREATISDVSLSADSNVRTEIAADDCTKITKLKPNDKCSVSLEITPNSPGKWTGEVVMIHDAPGRVSRATLSGATAGEVGAGGQQPGLSLVGANKDQMIDFGTVPPGGNAVRSVLLANDSPNPLLIEKLELVAADRSLSLMGEGGCVEGAEVAPGGSCPVTVIWQPGGRDISTDLIIRHTGPMGFAVIPVRGKTGGEGGADMRTERTPTATAVDAPDMEAMQEAPPSLPVGKSKIPAISAGALYGRGHMPSNSMGSSLVLRGTSGKRAILADADGNVIVAGEDEVIQSDGTAVRILNVEPHQVMIDSGGVKMKLDLVMPASGGSKTKTEPTSMDVDKS